MLLGRTTPQNPGWTTAFGWPASTSGERVTPESAKGLSAYYACIRNISEDCAKLPMKVARRSGETRTELPDHRLSQMFNASVNPETAAFVFRETMQAWAMGWGNGWAEVVRNNRGEAQALWLIHPERVSLKRAATGELYCEVTCDTRRVVRIPYDDVLHLHGLGDGLLGDSVAQVGCDSIGRALAVQKHSGAVFASGAVDRLAFEHPGKLSEVAMDNIRRSWAERYGGASNAAPAVLSEGMKANRIGIPAKDAQMLETMQFTVEDLARWFRCPPSKIQYFLRAQGWSTIEHLDIEYVRDTLLGWAIRWEQEIARKLLLESEADIICRHNFKGLLRADTQTQTEHYRIMSEIGVYTVNDILLLEDRNPIGPEGDIRHVPENWGVLEVAASDGGDGGDGNFKRDVVKALIADGTIGDVIFNMMDGRKLLSDVNISTYGTVAEPWLPVVAASGPLVSGAEITDEAGDVVGGDVMSSSTGVEDPQDEPPGDGGEPPADEPGPPAPYQTVSDPPGDGPPDEPGENEDGDSAVVEAARAAVAQQWERVWRKQAKAARSAVKRYLDRGDEPGFRDWCQRWFEDFEAEVAETVGPASSVYDMLAGEGSSAVDLAGRHVNSSRAQLLAVLRDQGVEGVRKRIGEWETGPADVV